MNRYHRGGLRAALIERAQHALETGAEALSLRALARELGVSPAAPYRHFADRQALVAEATAGWMHELVDAQAFAAAAAHDAREALIAAGTASVRWALAHPRRFALVFSPEIHPGATAEGHPMAAPIERHARLLGDLVAAAAREGAIGGDPLVAGMRMWAAVHGLAVLVASGVLPAEAVDPVIESLVEGAPRRLDEGPGGGLPDA